MNTLPAPTKGFELTPDGKVFKNTTGCYQSRVRLFRNASDTESIVRAILSKLNYCSREDNTGAFVAYKTSISNNAATKTTIQIYSVGDNLTEVNISGSITSGSQLMSFVCKKNVSELVSAIESYSANSATALHTIIPAYDWAASSFF